MSGSAESGLAGGGLLGEEQNRHIAAMVTPIYCSSPHPNLIPGVTLVTHLLFYYLTMILLIVIKNKLRDTIIINCKNTYIKAGERRHWLAFQDEQIMHYLQERMKSPVQNLLCCTRS